MCEGCNSAAAIVGGFETGQVGDWPVKGLAIRAKGELLKKTAGKGVIDEICQRDNQTLQIE